MFRMMYGTCKLYSDIVATVISETHKASHNINGVLDWLKISSHKSHKNGSFTT